ncbi:MAG: hypothetical protein QOJ13_3053 [Gaiellales bacterium]|nr:hypothetical protein [Gaiellales bacterium]
MIVRAQPPVADYDAIGQVISLLARLVDIARHDLEVELGRQFLIGMVRVADHLPAELQRAPVGEDLLLDAAADAITRLQYEHIRAGASQVAGSAEPRQARPQHQDVVRHGVDRTIEPR